MVGQNVSNFKLHSNPSQVVFDSSHAGDARFAVVVVLVVVAVVIVAAVATVVVLAEDEAGRVAVGRRRRRRGGSLCREDLSQHCCGSQEIYLFEIANCTPDSPSLILDTSQTQAWRKRPFLA